MPTLQTYYLPDENGEQNILFPQGVKEVKGYLFSEEDVQEIDVLKRDLQLTYQQLQIDKQTIADKEVEIERLKGLMKQNYILYMVNTDIKGFDIIEAEKAWKLFSDKNNL